MSSSDRPPRAYLSESAPRQTAPPIDSTEWRLWLRAQLLAHGYARQTDTNHIRYYLLRLEHDIAQLQPDAPVSIDTLRSVVYRNVLPLHRTARGLAAAFGISEVAVLLRSGQLDWDAVKPLLDASVPILRSGEEYRAALAQLDQEIRDPLFRGRVAELLHREWEVTQRIVGSLRWLGISAAEWEQIRADLNSPEGRRRLALALTGQDAAPNDERLPQEYLDALRLPDQQ
jgi:hypothetical protein